ncbi:hypothetical protein B0H14DRAFT_3762717 [Mycena olivaceomarginata]|nr:hypothetical protein B0H14DRAFT_3762717 [Mycena olivaceomarginata]
MWEYETDVWISVFNVTLSLSRVIKVYGEAFALATPAHLAGAIATVVHHILMVCTLAEERLDHTKFEQVEFHQVVFGERAFDVVKFDVLEGWVSFHHALHWLLAELFKHVSGLDATALREAGYSSVREIIVRQVSEQAVLAIIDFPLQALAMIAQIRTGLWVHNGFAIRSQLLHYCDFMLRELCYDQDLFVLQTALIILPPNTIFVSILDRFGLMGYFSGAMLHAHYEGAQLSHMVEEFLYVLVVIMGERAAAACVGIRSAVRREIVHALVVVKHVTERLVDDVCFEAVLSEVARFRAPDGTANAGAYELRDEVFDEVDLFFYHYTCNRREDVERILLAQLRRTTGVAEPVLVPKPLGISDGPFVALLAGWESTALMEVLFYALHNVLVITEEGGAAPPSAEAILDQALHLIMLALVERPPSSAALPFERRSSTGRRLVDVVCTLEHHAMYRTYRAHSAWVLGEMEKHVPEAVRSRRTVLDTTRPKVGELEVGKKCATAKARQEALLRQMKAQQASFADTFDDGSDEEDAGMDDTEEEASSGTCIVCQEDLTAARPFENLGMTPASLDRTIPGVPGTAFLPPQAEARDAKAGASPNFEGFLAQFTRFGLHASVCSHMMHLDCFQSLGNVILPVSHPAPTTLVRVPFPNWIRVAGIGPDPLLDSLQFRNGMGKFVFWSAQDSGYSTVISTAAGTKTSEGSAMCSGAIGVYFLVKRCMLLYVYSNNGTFSPPPYLNAHGEVDISMRFPQARLPAASALCMGEGAQDVAVPWVKVRKMWLSHGIPTVIVRRLEVSLDSGGWDGGERECEADRLRRRQGGDVVLRLRLLLRRRFEGPPRGRGEPECERLRDGERRRSAPACGRAAAVVATTVGAPVVAGWRGVRGEGEGGGGVFLGVGCEYGRESGNASASGSGSGRSICVWVGEGSGSYGCRAMGSTGGEQYWCPGRRARTTGAGAGPAVGRARHYEDKPTNQKNHSSITTPSTPT